MLSKILGSFFEYAKNTSVVKMIIHFLLFFMLIAWLSLAAIITMNFPFFVSLYHKIIVNGGTIATEHQNTIKRIMIIQNIMKIFAEETGIERITLFRLHDGVVDASGRNHFLFVSGFAEYVKPGFESRIVKLQRVPISVFGTIFGAKDNSVHIFNENNIILRDFLKTGGTKDAYINIVRDKNGSIIGLLLIEKITGEFDEKLTTKEVLKKLDEMDETIRIILKDEP